MKSKSTDSKEMARFGEIYGDENGIKRRQGPGCKRRVLGEMGNVVPSNIDVVVVPPHRPPIRRYASFFAPSRCNRDDNKENEINHQTAQGSTTAFGFNSPPQTRRKNIHEEEEEEEEEHSALANSGVMLREVEQGHYAMANNVISDVGVLCESGMGGDIVESKEISNMKDSKLESESPVTMRTSDGESGTEIPQSRECDEEDLYESYKVTERLSCVPPDYMAKQPEINATMRAVLVDWMINVHRKSRMVDETLYLSVNITDRYLSRRRIERKELRLVGITAMFIACKYEEVSVPRRIVEDLLTVCQCERLYTKLQVYGMERSVLNALKFVLSVPTPYTFMSKFLTIAKVGEKHKDLSFFLLELCLVEYQCLRFRPSLLAASAVYTAYITVQQRRANPRANKVGEKRWINDMLVSAGRSEEQLMECVSVMVRLHEKAFKGSDENLNLTTAAVHDKYATTHSFSASRPPLSPLPAPQHHSNYNVIC